MVPDGYKHGPGQQTADVAHRRLSEHTLCVRVLDLLPQVVNKTLTDWLKSRRYNALSNRNNSLNYNIQVMRLTIRMVH